jgi:hypothetical protein
VNIRVSHIMKARTAMNDEEIIEEVFPKEI